MFCLPLAPLEFSFSPLKYRRYNLGLDINNLWQLQTIGTLILQVR